MNERPRIAVAGAGAIGLFVGGLLARAGHSVSFLARPRIVQAVAAHGLHLTDYAGLDETLTGLALKDDPATAFAGADVVLVTVKSAATPEMAALIAAHVPEAASVISLQNGVSNPAILREALPGRDVRAGMVPFNVVPTGPATYHRGTSGAIQIEGRDSLARRLTVSGLDIEGVADMTPVMWGKLLINLGNAINALSDLPLLDQLMDRDWRRLMADQMAEAMHVMRVAGIRPAAFMALPPALVPHVLRLPTPVFRRIAARMVTIDPKARSSMWDDLKQGRPTEIDALQGEILRLAERTGEGAPLNARIAKLISGAEAAGKGPPGLSVLAIRQG